MITDEQQRTLLKISDLKNGWCADRTGKRFKPIIIRNARFLLMVFNDPTIDITPVADGKSVILNIHKPISSIKFDLPEDTKSIAVNVYSTKFIVSVFNTDNDVVYQENYNMRKFVNTYMLS